MREGIGRLLLKCWRSEQANKARALRVSVMVKEWSHGQVHSEEEKQDQAVTASRGLGLTTAKLAGRQASPWTQRNTPGGLDLSKTELRAV